ncbi:hypothetical protein NLJ89_g11524 [Agrocybe chaxingu]|uniref:Uncharacterized protein n=1 Tax=Agrocybe chaxingu TaxID=84603 RepID=A0A9W8JS68_9AGAR|nr:hypothetical protein NLJ89_g11524 [Agrocybe chaxingu]
MPASIAERAAMRAAAENALAQVIQEVFEKYGGAFPENEERLAQGVDQYILDGSLYISSDLHKNGFPDHWTGRLFYPNGYYACGFHIFPLGTPNAPKTTIRDRKDDTNGSPWCRHGEAHAIHRSSDL